MSNRSIIHLLPSRVKWVMLSGHVFTFTKARFFLHWRNRAFTTGHAFTIEKFTTAHANKTISIILSLVPGWVYAIKLKLYLWATLNIKMVVKWQRILYWQYNVMFNRIELCLTNYFAYRSNGLQTLRYVLRRHKCFPSLNSPQ